MEIVNHEDSLPCIKTRRHDGTYLGECDIGNDDLIQGAGGILEGLGLVTVRVVLVFGEALLIGVLVLDLPRHGALSDTNVALGSRARGLAAEIPANEAQAAGHYGIEDLRGERSVSYAVP